MKSQVSIGGGGGGGGGLVGREGEKREKGYAEPEKVEVV